MLDYALLIPALPLAAFLIIVFFTRVMDVRARSTPAILAGAPDAGHSAGLTHEEATSADRGPTDQPGAQGGDHDTDTLHAAHGSHDPTGPATHDDTAHDSHGHAEHGDETPL